MAAGSGDAASDLLFVQVGTVHRGARNPAANHHRRTNPRKKEPGHTVLSAELTIKLNAPKTADRSHIGSASANISCPLLIFTDGL